MIHSGVSSLSNAELIAVLLRTGGNGNSVSSLSQRLMKRFDNSLKNLSNADIAEILSLPGIGLAKATAVMAAMEFGKRLYNELVVESTKLDKPEKVFTYCHEMRFLEVEVLRVIALNSKLCVLAHRDVTSGIANETLIHPREVYRFAVKANACFIIVVHNHPSGDPSPSLDDKRITQSIVQAGDILGIKLVDHVIVGRDKYYSFRAEGLIRE